MKAPSTFRKASSIFTIIRGSLIFYALKDYLGEEVMNAAMREALNTYGNRRAPYMTSIDFLKILKSRSSSSQLTLIEDMLEKIVLFENRLLRAEAELIAPGKYDVTLQVSSMKVYSDKDGKEFASDFKQEIDIGVLGQDQEYIYLEKHLVSAGESTIRISVEKEPAKAGIDPLNILIDRIATDNIVPVFLKK